MNGSLELLSAMDFGLCHDRNYFCQLSNHTSHYLNLNAELWLDQGEIKCGFLIIEALSKLFEHFLVEKA